MNKLKNPDKLKIIFLFFMSNICTFVLTNEFLLEESPDSISQDLSISREGYSDIIIEASLKTEFTQSGPVTLISKQHNTYIPYVFLIKELQKEEQEGFEFEENRMNKTRFLVQVKNQYIEKLLRSSDLLITPNLEKELLLKRKKGDQFELKI